MNCALSIVLDNAINDEIKMLESKNKKIKIQLDAINDVAHTHIYVLESFRNDDNEYEYTNDDEYKKYCNTDTELEKQYREQYEYRSDDDNNEWHIGFYDAMSECTRLCRNLTDETVEEFSLNQGHDETISVEEFIKDELEEYSDHFYCGDVNVRNDVENDLTIDSLSSLLNKPINNKLEKLRKEHYEMKLKLNAITDIFENAEPWYFNLVSFARRPFCMIEDYIYNFNACDRDRLIDESVQIAKDNNYSHGFNSGMLAASRQFGQIATAADFSNQLVEECDSYYDSDCDECDVFSSLIEQAKDDFPFLDT